MTKNPDKLTVQLPAANAFKPLKGPKPPVACGKCQDFGITPDSHYCDCEAGIAVRASRADVPSLKRHGAGGGW